MRDEVKALMDAIEETAKGRTRIQQANIVIALIQQVQTYEQRQKKESINVTWELINGIKEQIAVLDNLKNLDPKYEDTDVYELGVTIRNLLLKVETKLSVTSANAESEKQISLILPALEMKLAHLTTKLKKKNSRNNADLALLKLINESNGVVGDLRKLINDLKQFAGPIQKITTLD